MLPPHPDTLLGAPAGPAFRSEKRFSVLRRTVISDPKTVLFSGQSAQNRSSSSTGLIRIAHTMIAMIVFGSMYAPL